MAGVGRCEAPDMRKPLDEAAANITYLSFDQALPQYQAVAKLVPEGSAQWQEAIFGEAVCQHQIMPASAYSIGEAKRLFSLLVIKCPDSRFTPRAMMNLGRIAELTDYQGDVSDREAARTWYEKAAQAAQGTPMEAEATLRIAATYVQTYQKEQVLQGIALLRDYVEKHPKDVMASAMWQYMGESYFYPLADYRNSLDCYKTADLLGLVESGREGKVYWRMAVMADRYLQDRDTAIAYYRKIIIKTPTSGKAYESQLALKRLGVEPPRIELFDMMGGGGQPASTSSPSSTAPSTRQEVAK